MRIYNILATPAATKEMQQLLLAMGYLPIEAPHISPGTLEARQELQTQIRETSPDLIIIDIHAGGHLKGLETGKAIEAENPIPTLYIASFGIQIPASPSTLNEEKQPSIAAGLNQSGGQTTTDLNPEPEINPINLFSISAQIQITLEQYRKTHQNPTAQPPQQQTTSNPPQQQTATNPPQQQPTSNPPQQQTTSNPPQQQTTPNSPQQQTTPNSPQQQTTPNSPQQQTTPNSPQQQTTSNPPQQQTTPNPPQQQTTSNPPQQKNTLRPTPHQFRQHQLNSPPPTHTPQQTPANPEDGNRKPPNTSAPQAGPGTDWIFVKYRKRLEKVNIHEILWIEAFGKYTRITTPEKRLTTSFSMKAMAEKLSPYPDFIRTHRSFMVNLEKVEAVEENNLHIAEHRIPIGKSYRTTIYKLLNRE